MEVCVLTLLSVPCVGGIPPSASYNVLRPSSVSGSGVMGTTNTQPKGAASNSSNSTTRTAGTSSGRSPRKKNHGCWMCHKSFDRPSTLRKVSNPLSFFSIIVVPHCLFPSNITVLLSPLHPHTIYAASLSPPTCFSFIS